jgi:hypothetical protein
MEGELEFPTKLQLICEAVDLCHTYSLNPADVRSNPKAIELVRSSVTTLCAIKRHRIFK